MLRPIATAAAMLTLAACSGSDSGSGGGGGGNSQPPLPTLTVTLDTATQSREATDQASASFIFTATYAGAPGGTVVPNVQVDGAVLALDGDIAASGNSYTVKLKSVAGFTPGTRTGDATFRLCRDAACSSIYPGSSQKFTYTLDTRLADWSGLQRNAAHTGYVPETFDPQKFSQAWQVTPATSDGVSLGKVSASKDAIFVTGYPRGEDQYRTQIVYAFELASGKERWRRVFTEFDNMGDTALAGDAVAFSTVAFPMEGGSQETVRLIGVTDGQDRRTMPFVGTSSDIFAPTVAGNELYVAGGPTVEGVAVGNAVYSFSLTDGAQRWLANGARKGIWKGETPAVDADYVYYYSGSLDVFRRSDGSLVSSVDDPIYESVSRSYSGAPMVSNRKSVIAYSGAVTGPYFPETQLVSYDTEASKVNWVSAETYYQAPAYANGTIYAASRDRARLEAIDEVSGQVRWSVSAGEYTDYVSNIVVTNNLVFYSTQSGVYAVTIAAPHSIVWSSPVTGDLAISPDGKLIVTGSNITAFNLR